MTLRTQKTLFCGLSVLLLSGCCEAAYGPGKCIEMEKQHRAMQHLVPHSDTTLNPVVPPSMPPVPVEKVVMQEVPQTKDMPVVDMSAAPQKPMQATVQKPVQPAPVKTIVVSKEAEAQLKQQMQAEQQMRDLQTKMAEQARQTGTQTALVPKVKAPAKKLPVVTSSEKTPAVEVKDAAQKSSDGKWLNY